MKIEWGNNCCLLFGGRSNKIKKNKYIIVCFIMYLLFFMVYLLLNFEIIYFLFVYLFFLCIVISICYIFRILDVRGIFVVFR